MLFKKVFFLLFLLAAVLFMAGCGNKEPTAPAEPSSGSATAAHEPGTISGDVYLSPDSDFTVQAKEARWTVREEEGEAILLMKGERNVWVSFSETEGLKAEMLVDFEDAFVERYLEGVRISYPDVKLVEYEKAAAHMARVDVSMSYASGLYSMYQIMYLITDGEDGYIVTTILPLEDAERLCPEIYELVETISFFP